MPVSKRLRYEVLRRDDYTCRYCGLRSADGLIVDHVLPTALGGNDGMANLVASCRDCNAGKAAGNPDEPLLQDVSQDSLRWAIARRRAAAEMESEPTTGREARQLLDFWAETWQRMGRGHQAVAPGDGYVTIRSWLSHGLSVGQLADSMELALARQGVADASAWRYFAGIAWYRLRELEAKARDLMHRGEV